MRTPVPAALLALALAARTLAAAPAPIEPEALNRLIERGVITADEARTPDPAAPVLTADAARWIARAFGVAADSAQIAHGGPDRPLARDAAIARCERAALAAYRKAASAAAPATQADELHASLLTGLGPPRGDGLLARGDLLVMISNLRFPVLRVIETTDVHGFVLPGAHDQASGRPLGGSAALAAWIRRLRGENPAGTVLVDGGDWFQGTMLSNFAYGRPVIEQMNLLGYDAAVIGNHEFDWGLDTLSRRIGELHCRALGANCVEKQSGNPLRGVHADTLITRRGIRIGVLGLSYPGTPTSTLPANVATLRFDDDSATAAHDVPELRATGAQVVVVVGHIPCETDGDQHAVSGDLVRLARGVHGVDAWLGGHSHDRIADEIGGVPVVIAGAHAEVVGVVDLTFDPLAGAVIARRERLQPTWSDSLAPDSAMAARVAGWNADVAPLAALLVGRTRQPLTRGTPNTIAYLVTDAMRSASGADIAFTNGGGLRADLKDERITRGGIFEVMPFDNTIVTLEMTPAELRAALEEGLAARHVLHPSGARLTYDLSRLPLHRLVSLTGADGAPLVEKRSYRVAINNFLATGGDGFTSFTHARNVRDSSLLLRTAIEQFVSQCSQRGRALEYTDQQRLIRAGGGAD